MNYRIDIMYAYAIVRDVNIFINRMVELWLEQQH